MEHVKEAPANDLPSNDPESGKCSRPSHTSPPVPDNCSVSMNILSSCHLSHNDDHITNIEPDKISPEINSILDALPSLDLNCEDAWPPLVPPASHTPCPYNLRSMGGKSGSSGVVGGLGHSSSQAPAKNKRGRHSHLSKAQFKAKLDVADGKQ